MAGTLVKISSKTGSNFRECNPSNTVLNLQSVTRVILGSCAHQNQRGCQSYKEICHDLTAIEISKRVSLQDQGWRISMYWAASSHLSPFNWANRCEENNDLATLPCKTLLLKVLGIGLLAMWGEALALSVFPIYSRLSISSDRGTGRHSATNGGVEKPQMCSEALWSYNANEAQNQSGRCFSPETP